MVIILLLRTRDIIDMTGRESKKVKIILFRRKLLLPFLFRKMSYLFFLKVREKFQK